jgi:nitrite reductase (NO-forming)
MFFLLLIVIIPGIYRLNNPGNIPSAQDDIPKSIERGKEVYSINCLGCHQSNGEGLSGVYPPLAKSDHLTKDQSNSIRIILKGQDEEITVNGTQYNTPMAPLSQLTDQQIADVLNYVGNNWGNHFNSVDPTQVKARRE